MVSEGRGWMLLLYGWVLGRKRKKELGRNSQYIRSEHWSVFMFSRRVSKQAVSNVSANIFWFPSSLYFIFSLPSLCSTGNSKRELWYLNVAFVLLQRRSRCVPRIFTLGNQLIYKDPLSSNYLGTLFSVKIIFFQFFQKIFPSMKLKEVLIPRLLTLGERRTKFLDMINVFLGGATPQTTDLSRKLKDWTESLIISLGAYRRFAVYENFKVFLEL